MFAAPGTYKPVGMFTTTHIVSVCVCICLIVLAVVLTRKMKKETYLIMLRVFAVVFTCLELFKIIWSLSMGLKNINSWMPLYFCSLFIYALWFTWSKNKEIRDFGLSFIAMAGIIAGGVFLICPSTSFNNYPIWHFQCLYSMIYHSTFVYSSIMIFVTRATEINFKLAIKYIIFCLVFMALALIMNTIWKDANLMFLSRPSVIPIPILKTIHNFSQLLYTMIIITAHLLMSFVAGIYWLINKAITKNSNTKNQA